MYVKRSDLQKLDTHEHRRTHCLNLGVKWSRVPWIPTSEPAGIQAVDR